MSERTYKVASATAATKKIWQADFGLDSFNDLVDKADSDTIVATVGMSDYSGPDRRVSMVVTLNKHPWMNDIADELIAKIRDGYETLDEWSVVRRDTQWVFTLKWRDYSLLSVRRFLWQMKFELPATRVYLMSVTS